MLRRSLDGGDSAAMRAALSLLDDMRDDQDADWLFGRDSPDSSSGNASVEDDDASAVTTSSLPIPKPVRKRKRTRRKDEIDYLRDKVQELERVLDATTQRIADAQGIATRDVELISIWEEVATRQQRKRDASERENAKLREMLASQVHVAKELLKFLEKQPREEDIPGVRALKRLQLQTEEDLLELSHDAWLRRMDALYARASTVFDDRESWTQRRTHRSVHVRDDDDSEHAIVDIHTSWVVPFELGAVAKVLRERSDRTSIQARCEDFETLDEKDRLLMSRFTGATHSASADRTEFRGRVVSRYYPEPADARVLIVTELRVEPVMDTAATRQLAYAVQSEGWIRLQPYKPNGETLQSETTQHLTHIQCFRSVQIQPRSWTGPSDRPRAGMFSELVLSHIREDMDESQQVIEDFLLQDDGSCDRLAIEPPVVAQLEGSIGIDSTPSRQEGDANDGYEVVL